MKNDDRTIQQLSKENGLLAPMVEFYSGLDKIGHCDEYEVNGSVCFMKGLVIYNDEFDLALNEIIKNADITVGGRKYKCIGKFSGPVWAGVNYYTVGGAVLSLDKEVENEN